MTVKELYNTLGQLMEHTPNTSEDTVYFLSNSLNLEGIDSVSIEYDIEDIGRYIVIR